MRSSRRDFLRATLVAGTGALGGPLLNLGRVRLFADGPSFSTRAVDLVARATVIDMLSLLTLDWDKQRRWHREPAGFGEAEYRQLLRSGVNVFHPAVEPNHPDPHRATLWWLTGWNAMVAAHPGYFRRVDGVADLERVAAERKLGLLLGFQNSDHFRAAADVAAFHALGQRVSQLTYNRRNRLGDGCKEPEDRGLTPFGAEVVAAMNEAGMAVDLSHCSERTTLDAIAASRRPVLVTHANCRRLVDHPRCKSDDVLRALARRGGVMGVTVLPVFASARPGASIEDVLDHFDHVARTVGIEHAGLGSDADLEARDPRTRRALPQYEVRGLHPARRPFEIAEGLLRRGYAEADVELVLGGNFRRALGEVWGPDAAPVPAPAEPPGVPSLESAIAPAAEARPPVGPPPR